MTTPPMAFYNENDPKAAAWLRELIKAGHIAPGVVDERSITDLKPEDLHGYNQCHFFAGIAGWSLALRMAGVSDRQPLWTGSCPCQPFSAAGKQLGTDDERHLWPAWFRLITQCRPPVLLSEQVASKAALQWLDGVFADLEGADYACAAADLCAAGVNAPHIRQRLFWLAYACGERRGGQRLLLREEEAGRIEADIPEASGSRSTGGLANTEDPDRRRELQPGESAANGRRGSTGDCATRGVAITDGGDTSAEREQRGGEQRQQPEDGGAIERLGHTHGPGRGEQSGAISMGPEFLGSERAGRGFWSDFDTIPCADGKARRIEPGTFPLVAGLPRGVVPSGDPGIADVKATAEARVMRLRGYGNAIVPQVAAVFIQEAFAAITEA